MYHNICTTGGLWMTRTQIIWHQNLCHWWLWYIHWELRNRLRLWGKQINRNDEKRIGFRENTRLEKSHIHQWVTSLKWNFRSLSFQRTRNTHRKYLHPGIYFSVSCHMKYRWFHLRISQITFIFLFCFPPRRVISRT